ncbi:MAG: PAS domain-containing protein [Chloroflexi bacterium]|nr:PAS domain-containing protein [Chloroflexota bacterium]
MPKKPKIDNRLDRLFKGIKPEESDAKEKRISKEVQKEVIPPPSDSFSDSKQNPTVEQKKPEAESHPKRPVKRHTALLVPPESFALETEVLKPASSYSVNFQTGDRDWSTLRILDDTQQRAWSPDEQLLVKQVVDQLSLALENARLFQEAQKFKLGIDRTDNAVFITDPNGVIQYTNPGFEKVYGYTNEEALGKTPRILKSGILPDDGYKKFWGTLLNGGTVSGEIVNKRKDGTIIPISGTNSPILDEHGKVLGFLAVHQDISERKKSEEQLRKSQEQYALAAEGANDGLWDWDITKNEIYYSPRWKSMLGYEEHELTKGFEDWENLIHPDDRDYALNARNDYLSGKAGTYDIEIRLRHKDGSWRWIRDRGKALRDSEGRAVRMAGSHSDVTERKMAEETIRRRNEYLAASAEIGRLVTSTLSLDIIFSRTVRLVKERFNMYYAAIFIVEEAGFTARLREGTDAAGAEMKLQGHSVNVGSKSVIGKVTQSGEVVVINNTAFDSTHVPNPLLPETRSEAGIPLRVGNRIIGALNIQSAQTDAFSQDELAVLQTLADQVAVAIDNARSFELSQQAVMEMREIDRLKSQFLANMSHELRTPLNSIIGFSRVILKGIDGPVSELQQQDLTAIYNSGQHLLGLINDVLDLSKIEAGKMELAFDEVNMVDITNSVISTMSGLIKDRPVELKKLIEPDLPTVRADAIRIRQVMINLISNASKFTDEGDIVVEVGLKPGPTGRNEVQVSVTDTGAGISEQDQAKLFQAFSQVDDSPTRKTGGTGLGLSICQHLVNMHGGRIWVESTVGKGSTFYFTIPLFRMDSETTTLPASNKVILSIDDDPQVIGLYERYLHPQGYQVIPLTDPSRAIERARQLKPFAITLDIMMPGVDGWTVLDGLKGDPETRNIPVIVCSIIEDLEKGFNLGAADYLVKPILEDDLVNSLDRLNTDGSIREVLVIDDNRDDLRLMGKILNDDGRYKAILVEGGKNGWDYITTGSPPHAIIMDLFMPEMDGFQILENLQASEKFRDIPVIVLSGMDVTTEQKRKLNDLGQRILSKGSFSEKELLTSIKRSLERIRTKRD